MFFTLSSHDRTRLEVSSRNGHSFEFDVVPSGRARRVTIHGARWRHERRPADAFHLLRGALRFATHCAKDCGLA